jgi:hypothetical protein
MSLQLEGIRELDRAIAVNHFNPEDEAARERRKLARIFNLYLRTDYEEKKAAATAKEWVQPPDFDYLPYTGGPVSVERAAAMSNMLAGPSDDFATTAEAEVPVTAGLHERTRPIAPVRALQFGFAAVTAIVTRG